MFLSVEQGSRRRVCVRRRGRDEKGIKGGGAQGAGWEGGVYSYVAFRALFQAPSIRFGLPACDAAGDARSSIATSVQQSTVVPAPPPMSLVSP